MWQSALHHLKQEYMNVPELGCIGEPAELSEIEQAEHLIGCRFSDSYRDFLQHCGCGLVGPYPVYGVRPLAMYPAEGTVVDVTAHFRAQGWPITDAGPVISTDLGGNPIVETVDGRIVTFDHDFGGFLEVGSNFTNFIQDMMKR